MNWRCFLAFFFVVLFACASVSARVLIVFVVKKRRVLSCDNWHLQLSAFSTDIFEEWHGNPLMTERIIYLML